MSGRYLTSLAEWIRAAGVPVIEYDGWKTRARSSGGYADGRPWCVMWHHTASTTSLENDARYCATGDPDAPVCNVLVGRDGTACVIAAGATNTNGKGYALAFTRGTVPNDQMNTHAVGVEICNSGVGEIYPAVQIDAAFAVSLAICAALELAPADVASHAAWAPDRKIDPATAAAVQGWSPHSINSSGTWRLEDLRAECNYRAGAAPTPIPPPTPLPDPTPPLEGDDMQRFTAAYDDNGTVWIGDGITRRPIRSEALFSNYLVLANAGAYQLVNGNGATVRGFGDVTTFGPDTLDALGIPAG